MGFNQFKLAGTQLTGAIYIFDILYLQRLYSNNQMEWSNKYY